MTHRQAHAENHTYVLLTNRMSDWHWYVELMYCMEKNTNCFGDKRWDYENYWWDQSWVQQPAPEINNNLLVTFLLLFYFFYSVLFSLQRWTEDRIKKVFVWPWKLIKNRCCDNHIKVMEALWEKECVCACVYVCFNGYWLLIIIL